MADPLASLDVRADAKGTQIVLTGRLDAEGAGAIWKPAIAAAGKARGQALSVDLTGVSLCDMAGAAFLLEMEAAHGADLALIGSESNHVGLGIGGTLPGPWRTIVRCDIGVALVSSDYDGVPGQFTVQVVFTKLLK